MQYVSDVHREYHINQPWPKIIPKAKYLALAGDIGNPKDKSYSNYISYCCSLFEHVFVVAGNHELWSHEIDTCKRKIRSICNEKANCTFLDDEVVMVNGVRVFGSILWSPVTERAAKGMNDYNTIFLNNKHLTPIDTRKMHSATIQRIEKLLEEDDTPLLVITHYAPLHKMNGDYGESPNISAFCGELEHLFRKPLIGWISGHTHSSTRTWENGIPCCSNCWGYDSKEYSKYNADAVVDVDAWGQRVRPQIPAQPIFSSRGYGFSRRPRPDPLDDKTSWLSKSPSPP